MKNQGIQERHKICKFKQKKQAEKPRFECLMIDFDKFLIRLTFSQSFIRN